MQLLHDLAGKNVSVKGYLNIVVYELIFKYPKILVFSFFFFSIDVILLRSLSKNDDDSIENVE